MKQYPDMIDIGDGEAFNRAHVSTVRRDKKSTGYIVTMTTGEIVQIADGHPAYDALLDPRRFYSDKKR